MLNSPLLAAIVSTAAGFLAALGVGGGSILLLWMTLVVNMPPETARIINLLFFLPAAGIASIFRWKQGKLRWHLVLPAALSGCVCAAIAATLASGLDTGIIRILFGILMLCVGIRELLYRPRKAR